MTLLCEGVRFRVDAGGIRFRVATIVCYYYVELLDEELE
jgi:hypothetical protein